MGCDIHLYIEYRSKTNGQHWQNLGGRINPGRNYLMFGIMSKGVRVESDFSYQPKGMPIDAGYCSENDNRLYITDEEGEDNATLENALQWEKTGSKITRNGEGKPIWVEHPDWHSHSWLTTDEYREALKFYATCEDYPLSEYQVILAAMEKFEAMGSDARIVFWFDN